MNAAWVCLHAGRVRKRVSKFRVRCGPEGPLVIPLPQNLQYRQNEVQYLRGGRSLRFDLWATDSG